MTLLWVDVVGWFGAGLVLVAYALLSAGKLNARGVAYQAMNVAGAVGMLINGYVRGALPSAALNLVWMGIGIYVLVKYRGRAA
ncbi:CBU_0592 family membrane protein [Sphingomonas sp. LT1P40]|uniref:CBU_0592 family membrane protein n=1 Tax=Alteristakelama amylovorans TaxID=3096166 RepID=UPI002FC62DEB